MNNLSIDKFNPLKAEIQSLVDNIKSTVISMPGDKTGYELMKEQKSTLQKKRTDTVKYLKSEREGAILYQKGIIIVEKELLGIIEPVEKELDEKIDKIDRAEARLTRLGILSERREKLTTIELAMTNDEILDMDDKQFAQFFVDKKMIYLEEKQAKIDAENKKIADEKAAIEAENKRQADLAKAREEAATQAKKDAEEDKKRAVQREKDKAAKKESDRLAAEAKEKQDKEDQLAKDNAEQERLEKMKKYQKFLSDNGCSKETEKDFYIKKEEKLVVLYKKVGEFKI